MTRTDYLVSRWERLLGFAPPTTIARPLRRPLVAFVAALALIGILAGVQQIRLSRALRDVEGLTQRLAGVESALRRLEALNAEVRRLRDVDAEVDRISRSGGDDASTIAAIGNEISGDAWLSAIRRDRDTYVLEGRSRHLSAVGTTLAALTGPPAGGRARLISVQDAPAHRGVSYAMVLETKP